MKITNLAVDNRTSILILVVIITIMGISAYVTLPRESSPDVSIPLVVVSTPYIGVSPEDIEYLVTQPIEKELKAIGEAKKIESSSFEGYSLIQVEFESGYDIDDALQKVRDKVNKAEPKLPVDAEKPEILEINISELPILTFNISGPVGLVRLKDIAEDLKDEIEGVEGVLEVKISGGMEREVKVDVDLTKLQHYNIRFDDIINSISNENRNVPGGSIDINSSSFIVRVPGEFKEPYLIGNIIVKLKDGQPVYVRDLASVSYDFKDRTSYARLNGHDAVAVNVSKRVGFNIISMVDNIKKIIEDRKEELPSSIRINITNDQSKEIKQQVRELENNIFSGLVLVVGVLFFFLGVRNAMFVAIAIPLSMLITFFVLQAVNITLNFVVLFALILALGMLVDNAIVIIENIYKFLEEGKSLTDAAKEATAEVAWPVISSTLTTLAAFFPLLFWPGVVGDFMFYIPATLIITLAASLFVALLINPVFASKYMKVEHPNDKPITLFEKIIYPLNRVTHFFVDVALPKTLEIYERTLRFALGPVRDPNQQVNKRNWFGVLSIIGFFVIEGILSVFIPAAWMIVVSLILGGLVVLVFTNNRLKFIWGSLLSLFLITQFYGVLEHGTEFFPNTQPAIIFVDFELPTGTNIDASNKIATILEDKILKEKYADIEDILVVVGASTNPFDAGSSTPNKGRVTVQFVDYADRLQNSSITTDQLRSLISRIPGVDIRIKQQDMGPPVGLPVTIQVSGDDYSKLGQIAEQIMVEIQDTPGLVDLESNYDVGKPEIRIIINREKAALYGLSTGLIANTVRTAINGSVATKYRVDEDEYDITVRLRKDQRESSDALKNLKIIYNNDKGTTLSVPLISVADITYDKGPGAIRRKNLQRMITVSGDAGEGYNENEVLTQVEEKLKTFQLPQGYTISFAGQDEEQAKASAFLGKAFLIALLLIFLILVIQFNSLSQPLIILSAVVISLVGVFIGLIVFAMPFGIIMTGIGIISLAGVVVNNNIVLIDYTNQLRKRGLTRREAIVTAGMRRFRPVTLTAITTVLGLIPLSFGLGFDIYTFEFSAGGESAEFWKSMGIAVIFGLTFATFLTLVIVPVIYSTLDDVPIALRQLKASLIASVKRLFKK
ncbi:MAG TPA: efflux RND transporter permease subunit [Ignavibacteriaceae bacterium]|nr:efflux RND transporter permease subunit [Ignavibacteriaceae bacterium]